MRIYGLTGGTGSGKSAAALRFEDHGIPVIDADKVGHDVIAPGGTAERGVIEAFGDDIVVDGRIDRAKLADRVFGDSEALQRLNGLVHPAIFAEIGQRCAAYAGEGKEAVLIDAALLGDNGTLQEWFAGLVLVLCPEEERIRRLVAYRGFTVTEARTRVAAQVNPEDKRPLATWIIDNSGDLSALHAQVDKIAEAIHGAHVG
jgi:dephospho-CoA kinase